MPRKAINEIPIDGTNYFMTHDALCWTLYFSGPKAKRLIGHFGQLSHLLQNLFNDLVNTSEATSLIELKEAVLHAEKTVLEASESLQTKLVSITMVEPVSTDEGDDEGEDDFIKDQLDFVDSYYEDDE